MLHHDARASRWFHHPSSLAAVSMALGICALLMNLSGCASADVDQVVRAGGNLPKPDFVEVHNFTTSHAEVQLDRGLSAKASRDMEGRTQTEEERRVGALVADAMTKHLVQELNKRGIRAYPAAGAPPRSAQTLAIAGQFISIDEGDRTKRVWVGFGLGGTQLHTRVSAYQNNQLVAQAQTSTTSSLKPGMLTSLGVGAATGGLGTAAAVGAGGATVSEAFLGTVEADARRTAEAIAERIANAYAERGW